MRLQNIDYHVCDVCNLNCGSCNHFCPLTKNKEFITAEQAYKDFRFLYEFGNKFDKLTLLGGEALLNPEIDAIIALANEAFPGRVKFITNGVDADKLISLKRTLTVNNVELVVTEYPFKEGWKEHYARLAEEFPDMTLYDYRVEHGFISEHLSYDIQDTDTAKLLSCDKRYKCVQYVGRKLYICHYAAYLDNLSYVTEMPFTNEDSYYDLEKYTEESFDAFFGKKIPEICSHCLYVKKPYEDLDKKPWKRTGRKAEEWIQ